MRRELTTNQQCEHISRLYENGALLKIPCEARHSDRSQGAPQQLVPVKDGRAIRFMCLKHAPLYTKQSAVYRLTKKPAAPEQERLL